MINQTLFDKLLELRLPAFRQGLREQIANPQYAQLSFEERLLLLVEQECTRRSDNRMQRRLKLADLPVRATYRRTRFRSRAQPGSASGARTRTVQLGRSGSQSPDPGSYRHWQDFPGLFLRHGCLPFGIYRSLYAYLPPDPFPPPRQNGRYLSQPLAFPHQNGSFDP